MISLDIFFLRECSWTVHSICMSAASHTARFSEAKQQQFISVKQKPRRRMETGWNKCLASKTLMEIYELNRPLIHPNLPYLSIISVGLKLWLSPHSELFYESKQAFTWSSNSTEIIWIAAWKNPPRTYDLMEYLTRIAATTCSATSSKKSHEDNWIVGWFQCLPV